MFKQKIFACLLKRPWQKAQGSQRTCSAQYPFCWGRSLKFFESFEGFCLRVFFIFWWMLKVSGYFLKNLQPKAHPSGGGGIRKNTFCPELRRFWADEAPSQRHSPKETLVSETFKGLSPRPGRFFGSQICQILRVTVEPMKGLPWFW